MKKIIKILVIFLSLVCFPFKVYGKNINKDYLERAKQDILVLMLAYPEQVVDVEWGDGNYIYIVMANGKRILYDDKIQKNYDQKFFKADLQDTLQEIYPLKMIKKVMDKDVDPGRIRNYELLGAMYGSTQKEIESNLKYISTYYGSVMFNSKNNACEELKAALGDIAKVAQNNERISSYVAPLSGGYNYRKIQDTGMLSPHAYGISIDLNRNDCDYWKWVSNDKGSARIASYPTEIVEIFEKHGFIWGGKWNHFDILHFEYRPEIILKAKYFKNRTSDKWYDGVEINECSEKAINLIEKKLSN